MPRPHRPAAAPAPPSRVCRPRLCFLVSVTLYSRHTSLQPRFSEGFFFPALFLRSLFLLCIHLCIYCLLIVEIYMRGNDILYINIYIYKYTHKYIHFQKGSCLEPFSRLSLNAPSFVTLVSCSNCSTLTFFGFSHSSWYRAVGLHVHMVVDLASLDCGLFFFFFYVSL